MRGKGTSMKKVDLRKLAKGQTCQARFVGPNSEPICNHNPETTVLAHVRRGGVAGVRQKPPDLCGFWACSDCHDAQEGRKGPKFIPPDTDVMCAVLRTLAAVSKLVEVVER